MNEIQKSIKKIQYLKMSLMNVKGAIGNLEVVFEAIQSELAEEMHKKDDLTKNKVNK